MLYQYKISTPEVDAELLLDNLQDKLSELAEFDSSFSDVDATIDFAACPTPAILTNIEHSGLRIIRRQDADPTLASFLEAYFTGDNTPETQIYFVENDKLVGKNCWTFLLHRKDSQMRAKN